GGLVAGAESTRAVQRRAVAGRGPGTGARGAGVARRAEEAVVTRTALVGGLGDARVGRLVAGAGGALAVQRGAVARRGAGAGGGGARVARGAEEAVVARAAFVPRLRLAEVDRLVAGADRAGAVEEGAAPRVAAAAAGGGRAADGAEEGVVAG